jgi:hypothetical protein
MFDNAAWNRSMQAGREEILANNENHSASHPCGGVAAALQAGKIRVRLSCSNRQQGERSSRLYGSSARGDVGKSENCGHKAARHSRDGQGREVLPRDNQ